MILPPDDLILIDKPAGMTSFGVVARVRRVLRDQVGKKVKVGHTGTLDPFATGLMILVTGKKCREAQSFTQLDKWYDAEFVLGQVSTTGDPEGTITPVSERRPTRQDVDQAAMQLTGSIEQTPPSFSAIKIGGQRAYKLARAGQPVAMPTRMVEVYQLEVVAYDYPVVQVRAHVSSGTYIRSLAEDFGKILKTGAYCRSLRRTNIAQYTVQQAKTLADLDIFS